MKPGFLILFTLFLNSLSGTAYYVSPTGDDLSKGNKWFTPFKTIQKAASMAVAGDTVYIMKGDYYSSNESILHLTKSGNENGWIVFRNYLNHKPVLHVSKKYGIHIQSCAYISIEGLTIVSDSDSSSITSNPVKQIAIFIDGSFSAPCTHIKIYNNFLQNSPDNGLFASYFDYLTISFNKLYNNSRNPGSEGAIYLKNAIDLDGKTVYHNFIQGNVMEKNGIKAVAEYNICSPAIYVEYDLSILNTTKKNTLIHNNIIYKNGGGGIHIKGGLGFDIVNNTLYKNSEVCREAEIEIANSSFFNVLNNIFYSSTAKPGSVILNSAEVSFKNNMYYNFSSKETGENDLINNPEFESANDKDNLYNFRLKGNSPAINAGIDELLADTDFEGNKRKMDTHVDIGALEFTNRLLPSLKNTKAGPQSKGVKTFWSSLYSKDQKVYTIWNLENLGFSIRVFDGFGNLVLENLRMDNKESSFEIDFNSFPQGFYTVHAYNKTSKHLERVRVGSRQEERGKGQ